MGCESDQAENSFSDHVIHTSGESWSLIYAQALGDGGTIVFVIENDEGQLISADIRSQFEDPYERLHIHAEPYSHFLYPESTVVSHGSSEEIQIAACLKLALAEEMRLPQRHAREKREAFADEICNLYDQAQGQNGKADEILLTTQRMAEDDSRWPTDRDYEIRSALAALHVLESRQTK